MKQRRKPHRRNSQLTEGTAARICKASFNSGKPIRRLMREHGVRY